MTDDAEFPEATRIRAAAHWGVIDIVIAFAIEGLGSPVQALLWLVAATFFMPVTWIWNRFKRKHLDKNQLFVHFHSDQMGIVCNLLWLGTIGTCGCGFPFLLIPAFLVMRAGRQAALRGEWWSVPLFGWIVGKPGPPHSA